MTVKCKICDSYALKVFDGKILSKYFISYYKCNNCGFLQTEEPFWITEAYSSVITSIDVGYVDRNFNLFRKTKKIIDRNFNVDGVFLDYAGGYGLFVRLMRDNGVNFFWHDDYCENLFAKHFEMYTIPTEKRVFEVITGFEVLEHIVDPYQMFNKIFSYTDSFLFSTELQIDNHHIQRWWYLAQEGGQHISFYTLKSLQFIASIYSCKFYSNGKNLHLFTRKKLASDPFARTIYSILKKIVKKKRISLLQKDFDYIKSLTREKNV